MIFLNIGPRKHKKRLCNTLLPNADQQGTINTILVESGDYMKKRIIVIIVFLLFSLSGCNQKSAAFSFDPQKYDIVGNDCGGNRMIPSTIQDMEDWARLTIDGQPNTYGAIIICTVSGDSINRIIEPQASERKAGVVYGLNHVLTPVKIEKLIYRGDDTSIEEGKEYYLKENYFYITKESYDYYKEFGDNCIYAKEYYPMTRGNTYLVYLTQKSDNIYNYQGETILSTIGMQESVYCLGDISNIKSMNITEEQNLWYYRLWDEANLLYGHHSASK